MIAGDSDPEVFNGSDNFMPQDARCFFVSNSADRVKVTSAESAGLDFDKDLTWTGSWDREVVKFYWLTGFPENGSSAQPILR